MTTNGLLDIRASESTDSSVLQAGRLNLDIGAFRQIGRGPLLAVQSFTGRGGDWSNDGLLASDGSLRLRLSARATRGNGRATSLGELALNAASLDLGNPASLAGGADVTLGAGNLLVNRGRITAAGDLVASAASLNNWHLGGGGNLRLNAPALLNERGLLLQLRRHDLRAGDITDLYGDMYSLGRLGYRPRRCRQPVPPACATFPG